MKLRFKQQSYQNEASTAIVQCFDGQPQQVREKVIRREPRDNPGLYEEPVRIESIYENNPFKIDSLQRLKNLQQVQQKQGLPVSQKLQSDNYSIEMETGTGKTYVYTKAIFELNKHYSWSKFIIMVPSIAIREGVYQSLKSTEEHFAEQYGEKIRFSIYNAQKKSTRSKIKAFGNDTKIHVMIMNYQAFVAKSKESRKLYQTLDSFQSEKPIDILKRTSPILIIDEPQRFGEKAEKMIADKEFNQLFTLRFSATHKKDKTFNKVYRLDALDAYNQKLVKKIAVKGIDVTGSSGSSSYLFLDRIQTSTKHSPIAYIELEKKLKSGIVKKLMRVEEKADLYSEKYSNGLAQYRGFTVKEINARTHTLTFTNGCELEVGKIVGDVDELQLRRLQIRETIASHLRKERDLFYKGIKVLSLFFIDEVIKYRDYSREDQHGEYARIFEEEYRKAIESQQLLDPKYEAYLNDIDVTETHKGYFSVDKKGHAIDSKEKKIMGGSDDESAFNLIMKNKLKLLSFNESTRFIFSHSALREGWDNPNVFQICTLKHSQSEISKRQEIGRGLRICVDEKGDRMDEEVLENEFFDTNTLTVIASESYDVFSRQLQNEILETLSARPIKIGVKLLQKHEFITANGQKRNLKEEEAMDLIADLKSKALIDKDYFPSDDLVKAIENQEYSVPEEFQDIKESMLAYLKELCLNQSKLKNYTTNERKQNINESILKPNNNFKKDEFQALWNKIKHKTTYTVEFDSNELIQASVRAVNLGLRPQKIYATIKEGVQKDTFDEQDLNQGTAITEHTLRSEKLEATVSNVAYDLIGEVAKEVELSRKTIVHILQGLKADTFAYFKQNPEDFIGQVSRIVKKEKAIILEKGIKYIKTDDIFTDDIFTINNFKGILEHDAQKVARHIYDYVKTDSEIEKNFVKKLESGEILVYAKLPNGFKIPTPIGNYNPDWAIVCDIEKFKFIYFIAETKGSMASEDLREKESKKIKYAQKYFEALNTADLKYDVISTYDDFVQSNLK